jgi:hypothetical protein
MNAAAVERFWQQAQLSPEEAGRQQQQEQVPDELQKQLSKLQQLPLKHKQQIKPQQWAVNILTVRSKQEQQEGVDPLQLMQNLRLSDHKGAEHHLAEAVVQRVVAVMPSRAALPDELFGIAKQRELLLSKLSNRQGLWLCGPGEGG